MWNWCLTKQKIIIKYKKNTNNTCNNVDLPIQQPKLNKKNLYMTCDIKIRTFVDGKKRHKKTPANMTRMLSVVTCKHKFCILYSVHSIDIHVMARQRCDVNNT